MSEVVQDFAELNDVMLETVDCYSVQIDHPLERSHCIIDELLVVHSDGEHVHCFLTSARSLSSRRAL